MANYVCSDLHGYLELYKKIKNFIKPEDTVYFLGDAGDRGPQPWETIKTIYKDSQFVYLKGNHEDLLVRAARDYLQYDCFDYSYYLHGQNGGFGTFADWQMEEFKTEWINHLDNLPVRAEYVNNDGVHFIMTHAGFTPYKDRTLEVDDLLIITSDHGKDPTFSDGNQHTRENLPLILYSRNFKKPRRLGQLDTLADIGALIADNFDLPKLEIGKSILEELE